ncbi:hypothetical protein COCON_G00051900 [Conger conger]|uniref:Ig-like domain-containing protein n=1 Tax=Conger conger TaxID=82655 RepID=A0A9Q1DVT0_CONCO|nr:B- and T-lymphocyte attenuator [Conger conger]KAJ8282671.1 hypothetical protein COCON_G00051900 [Conger conger]
MRPRMERPSLALSLLLLVIYCPGDLWGHNKMKCTPSVQIKRHTRYKAVEKESLKITCPVYSCGQTFNLAWCRLDNVDFCRPVNITHSIKYGLEKPKEVGELDYFFLFFANISLDDAGRYRCGISNFVSKYVSHSITVNFTESLDNGNENSYSSKSILTEEELQGYNWIPYFSICTIILAVVIMVMMISFLCIYGCKRLQGSRNAHASCCQYNATKDMHGISTANQTTVDRNSSHAHDNELDRHESSMIYVTLNNQSRQEGSAHRSVALEDHTEYATIRVS